MYKRGSGGKLQMEAGGTYYTYEAMTKQANTQHYEVTTGRLFSNAESVNGVDQRYIIAIDGLKSGCRVIPAASLTADKIDVEAGVVVIAGVEVTVTLDTDVTVTRGGSSHIKYSICVNGTGVVSALAGTTHTAFSSVRGADGGPPHVTVGLVEIAQVWYSSLTPAVVASTEIKFVPEQHRELSYYPGWFYIPPTTDDDQKIEIGVALTLNHTGDISRIVYAEYYNPVFVKMDDVSEVKPPRKTYTATEENTYDAARKVSNESLGDGSFKILMDERTNSLIKQAEGDVRWFKWFADKTKTDYVLFQGRVQIVDEYPVKGIMQATVTIVTEVAGIDK